MVLALVLSALTAGPADVESAGPGEWRVSFEVMGTRATILAAAPDPATSRAAGEAAREELSRIERLMSEWLPDSPLSAVNAAAGVKPVAVPVELYAVIARSLDVARDSGGAFDPTWAGMRGVWKFGDGQDGKLPPPALVEEKRRLVDFRRVRLDAAAHTVFLERPGMALGLGGIAKGYAVDRVVEKLRGLGLSSFIVQLGGDVFAAGTKGQGAPWMAGIRDPRGAGTFAALPLSNASFSTSGDYERFFLVDGIRYHHIIDPSTGYPATASRSVTARCKDAYTADAVTKPVFILGPEKGMVFAAKYGCDVVIVDARNVVHVSPGLTGALRLSQPTP